jgi:cytochrome c biogenesis protein CcmG/thiol:disulfide interchange protein DsbE
VNLNHILRAALGLLIAVFLGVVGWSLRDTSAKEGGPAPQFSLVTDGGHRVTPTSFGGKVLVLNFWASWCAPCLQEIPSLNRFQREFAKDGVVVVAVSIDKNEQKYKRFLQRLPVSFETARDPSADVSRQSGTFHFR